MAEMHAVQFSRIVVGRAAANGSCGSETLLRGLRVFRRLPTAGASRASLRGRLRQQEVEEKGEQSLPLSVCGAVCPPTGPREYSGVDGAVKRPAEVSRRGTVSPSGVAAQTGETPLARADHAAVQRVGLEVEIRDRCAVELDPSPGDQAAGLAA